MKMTHRTSLTSGLMLPLLIGLGSCTNSGNKILENPDILVIMTDQQSASWTGNKWLKTPAMDHVKGYRNKLLTETQKARNKEKSRTRVRVVRQLADGFIENSMNGSFIRTIGITRAKTIPIIIGRDDSSREIAKLLFHRVNLIYNICHCTQLKIVVAMG